ncbi:hypothetical protein CPB85DRAFT_1273867 [Mucidula mucida]|nr:hypothetical protein CPB85DRAFT_1273867 [Mucidula mucida]
MATAKSIPVLDESELKDGEMKEVSFEQGKVLLARLGDQIHATSAFCTHYGAPLAKGVLSNDGHVTCPWHGACFNLSTGDIEDAPAPAGLHSFQAHVAAGKIYVTANPEHTIIANKSRPPKLSTTGFDAVGKGVIIVGGGAGAFHVMESLRENGYKYPITMLSREPHAPIDRTKLSKALITDASKVEWKSAAELKIKFGTNLRTGVNVTSLDLVNRKVVIDGKDALTYDKLVLATGSTPRRLPIPGADCENVYTFRGIEDSKTVDAAAQKGKRAVLIGTSFISMELAVAMGKRELASIDVIGMEEVPFETILGKKVGQALMKYHESQGIKFHMQVKVEKIVTSEENDKLATGVVVNGETIPADFVIMGVGVAPATELLKDHVELEKDGGVKVDEYMRVLNVPNTVKGLYAIGDIAVPPLFTGQGYARIEHWNVASNQGRALGQSIAGIPKMYKKVPVFWSAQGQQLRYCGYGVGFEDVIITGDAEKLKFVAYYVLDNRVTAMASMQNDPVMSKCAQLLRLGIMPSPEELRGGLDPLSIDISSQNSVVAQQQLSV